MMMMMMMKGYANKSEGNMKRWIISDHTQFQHVYCAFSADDEQTCNCTSFFPQPSHSQSFAFHVTTQNENARKMLFSMVFNYLCLLNVVIWTQRNESLAIRFQAGFKHCTIYMQVKTCSSTLLFNVKKSSWLNFKTLQFKTCSSTILLTETKEVKLI